MRFTTRIRMILLTGLMLSSFSVQASAYFEDEYAPEITARVARVSLLKGEAQIKREGSEEWERVTVNLPLTQGCEIVLNNDSRMEIQLDSRNYLRVDEGARIKITTLNDDGVALSLIAGTAMLRIGEFDANRNFFEVDAPRTTVAVKSKGSYRIDAGDDNSTEVRLTVTDGGEARLYSESSGFTVRSNRSATLYLIGDRAGEWETSAAARGDAFDRWNADRDEAIAKRLKNSHFGRFYDNDQYGAEELDDNGEWVHTAEYGYVWRPYRNVTARYRDWSPYRYGHWRWFPPYGWTWVNDEPWGWVTYHHGRWVFHAGYWHWSPYSAYRWRRSWWRPAFVTIVVYNGRTCWYPMTYYSVYFDFNRRYYDRWRHRSGNGHRDRGGRGDRVAPPAVTDVRTINPGGRFDRKPVERIPPSGVVAVGNNEFGRTKDGARTVPSEVANTVLSDRKDALREGTDLPDWGVTRGGESQIRVDNPRIRQLGPPARTGAAERTEGAPIGGELEKKKIFQDRVPTRRPPVRDEGGNTANGPDEVRRPGAVNRNITPLPPSRSGGSEREAGGSSTDGSGEAPRGRFNPKPIDRDGGSTDSRPSSRPPRSDDSGTDSSTRTQRPPIFSRPPKTDGSESDSGRGAQRPPIFSRPPSNSNEERTGPTRTPRPPVTSSPPANSKPPRTESPRDDGSRTQRPPVYSRPPQNDSPRSNPAPRNESPRPAPPRQTPPRSDPPARSEPPPRRESPKESPSENKPPLRRKGEPE